MRATVVVVILVLVTSTASGLGYTDHFGGPDGTFPGYWSWTGDPRGGGSFLVYDGAFTHVTGGSVYYYRTQMIGSRPGWGGTYRFRVKGSNWIFAWRITAGDGTAGRCLWLSHDDLWGSWGYTFAEFSWETLDPAQYPDGAFMWHNGAVLRSAHHATEGPLKGWRTVIIEDRFETHAVITVDYYEEIFYEPFEFIEDGFQGIGCMADGEMTPAFDFIEASWNDPVEQSTWGSIKALYR